MGAFSFRYFPVLFVLWTTGTISRGAEVDFERDIRPILAEKCTLCHGPDETKAGLRLTGIDHATKVLESGLRGIVPGEPEASEVMHRVRASDPEEIMPPPDKGEPLTEEESAKLEGWIASGAVWPKHLAYAGLSSPPVPSLAGNPVDAFVLDRLGKEGIEPSPDADDITLIRRFFYDLAGLPPTLEQLATYRTAIGTNREVGLTKLADDLLEGSAFGERWGRHWLDRAAMPIATVLKKTTIGPMRGATVTGSSMRSMPTCPSTSSRSSSLRETSSRMRRPIRFSRQPFIAKP